MCIEAVDKLAYLWEHSSDEDRQGIVRNLFDYVEYDLDARRITSFRLKPWADRFVVLRGALYEAQKLEAEGEKEPASPVQGVKQEMPHRGLKTVSCFDIWLATFHIIEMLYDTPFPEEPQNNLTLPKAERNAEIIARYETGEALSSIAQAFGISHQRVHQIVHGKRK